MPDVIAQLRAHVEQLDEMAPSMDELIVDVEARQPRSEAPSRWWERRRRWPAAAAAAALLVVGAVAFVVLQGRTAALAVLAFPDGSEIAIEEFFAAEDDEALNNLELRLAEFGIRLEVRTRPVNPEADRRIYSVDFGPSFETDESGRVIISEAAIGDAIVIEIGVGDSSTGNAGLFLFEAYPEICLAVQPRDTAATNAALARLGIKVDWTFVTGDPNGGGLSHDRVSEPPPGVIISVLTADYKAEAPSRPDRLAIEVIPEDAVWHEPTSTERCSAGSGERDG